MDITELELMGLRAAADSDYAAGSGVDGEDLIGHQGWTFGYVDTYVRMTKRDRKSAGGVLASLVEKGLLELSSYEKTNDCVSFTRAGYEALAASTR